MHRQQGLSVQLGGGVAVVSRDCVCEDWGCGGGRTVVDTEGSTVCSMPAAVVHLVHVCVRTEAVQAGLGCSMGSVCGGWRGVYEAVGVGGSGM